MAVSAVTDFIVGAAGLAIAVGAIVVTVAVFMVIARLGNAARPFTDKK